MFKVCQKDSWILSLVVGQIFILLCTTSTPSKLINGPFKASQGEGIFASQKFCLIFLGYFGIKFAKYVGRNFALIKSVLVLCCDPFTTTFSYNENFRIFLAVTFSLWKLAWWDIFTLFRQHPCIGGANLIHFKMEITSSFNCSGPFKNFTFVWFQMFFLNFYQLLNYVHL